MCNFYMYYYAPHEQFQQLDVCETPGNTKLFETYPTEATEPASSNIEMEMQSFSKESYEFPEGIWLTWLVLKYSMIFIICYF